MPRRRGGQKYKIRKSLAILKNKSPQKRGNNFSWSKYIAKQAFPQLCVDSLPSAISSPDSEVPFCGNSLGRKNIRIISDVIIRNKIVFVDRRSCLAITRLIGESTFHHREIYQPDCDTISEASTLSRSSSPSDIEVITLD